MTTALSKREDRVRERKAAKNILEHLSTRLSPGEFNSWFSAASGP
jgi:hypothetical protein